MPARGNPNDGTRQSTGIILMQDAGTIQSFDVAFENQNLFTIRTFCVVDIGTNAKSELMKTDYGNLILKDDEFNYETHSKSWIYFNKPINYYNLKNKISNSNNHNTGLSCGGQGDMCRL
jgi:hypothetical protein